MFAHSLGLLRQLVTNSSIHGGRLVLFKESRCRSVFHNVPTNIVKTTCNLNLHDSVTSPQVAIWTWGLDFIQVQAPAMRVTILVAS